VGGGLDRWFQGTLMAHSLFPGWKGETMDINGKKKYYEERPGETSTMRVALIMSLVMGFVLALMVIYIKWDAGIFLPVTMWGAGFTGKVTQKYGEKR
jgi:hypothetical protein